MREKPSAPMILSIIAVVLSLAGTGVASISALSHHEKKQVKRIAGNEVRRLAPALSVKSAAFADTAGSADTAKTAAFANSAASADTAGSADTATFASTAANANQLGGIGAGGFVQGNGRQVPVHAYLNVNEFNVVLVDASGVGRLTASCNNGAQDLALSYTDTSGAEQVASGSVVDFGASSTVNVLGGKLFNNTNLVQTGSGAGNSESHEFSFDAAPLTATGAPGFSFDGTGWTKVNGADRCVVSGVATIG